MNQRATVASMLVLAVFASCHLGSARAEPRAPGPQLHGAAAMTLQLPPTLLVWGEGPPPREKEPPKEGLLPFADNDLPAEYPALGFTFGLGGYASDFSGVEEAFHAMEAVYGAAGYPVPPAGPVNLAPMQLYALTLRFNPTYSIVCQANVSAGDIDRLSMLGLLVGGRLSTESNGALSLSAQLGGGKYGFEFERAYNTVVTADGYYVLEHITLEGGGWYWTGAADVAIRLGPKAAIDLVAQYVGMGDESTETARAGPVSVNLSGIILGASCTLYY